MAFVQGRLGCVAWSKADTSYIAFRQDAVSIHSHARTINIVVVFLHVILPVSSSSSYTRPLRRHALLLCFLDKHPCSISLAVRCCGDGKPYRFILRDKQYEETGIQFETVIQVKLLLLLLAVVCHFGSTTSVAVVAFSICLYISCVPPAFEPFART